jgi:3-oxoacyl-[acyl-carrier-protein] synthase II
VTTPRVWVTGLGVVSALGRGVEAFFAGLLRGQSALSPVENIPIARGKQLAGQVKDPAFAGPHHLSAMANAAVEEAIAGAGLEGVSLDGCGLYLGTVASESRLVEDRWAELAAADVLSPELREGLLRYPNGALADLLAARFGIFGPRDANTNACASGNIALARALLAIRAGRITRAIVCGADQLKPIMYWGTERAGLMGHDLRPFHKDRDGTVFGDGVGVMVLEAEATARARGASPLAELAGWGVVCDENPQLILPQLDGGAVARGFLATLADAGLDPAQVDHVNAHGTGTINIDRIESLACKKVFGARASSIPVNATKSLTGHLSAASPLVEGIATVLAIARGYIHPTAKLDEPDPDLGLDFVPLSGRHQPVTCAVSNSMGGGGTNAAVVFTAPGLAPKRVGPEAAEVVVTGIGSLSVFGDSLETLTSGVRGGQRPAGGRLDDFDIRRYVGAELKYEHLSRAAQLALAAAIRASEDANLPVPWPAPDRMAVVMGTAFGGTPAWSEMLCEAYTRDPRQITPNMALEHGHHLGVTLIARRQHARGPNCTLTGGWTAGLEAIAFGAELLRDGLCDVVLVGGVDSLDRILDRSLTLLGCSRKDTEAVRPYHAAGTGFSPAEGAGCLVLETREAAARRGARVRAAIRGFGSAAAPVGPGRWDESGQALARAMAEATREPRLADKEVLVYGAGNGAPANDAAELRALAQDRGRSFHPVLTSLRGCLGETLGAGGALSAVAGLGLAASGAAPPALDLPGLWSTTGQPSPWLLVNSASPGGAAASLLLEVEGAP